MRASRSALALTSSRKAKRIFVRCAIELRPHAPAARFIASVVPRTKSRQLASARPQKRATRTRAAA